MNKGFGTMGLLVSVLVATTIGLVIFAFIRIYTDSPPPPQGANISEGGVVGENENTACTMDAKICPDGSYVSRELPDCEFALCPGEKSISEILGTEGGREKIACPLDAKLCSDGSYVSRELPDCEFALCPDEQEAVNLNWDKYNQNPGGIDWGDYQLEDLEQ